MSVAYYLNKSFVFFILLNETKREREIMKMKYSFKDLIQTLGQHVYNFNTLFHRIQQNKKPTPTMENLIKQTTQK